MQIPFNRPTLTGKESGFIRKAMLSGRLSGDGLFTRKCQSFLEKTFGFKKVLLTTSCTDALEMTALLADIQPGDEVIMPSFTFVSTANAFALRGANIVFADSNSLNPNMDAANIEALITKKTKAIVPVHYAGIACEMDTICRLANQYNLLVIEDAAAAIDSYYKEKTLGTLGNFAAFSFHETKNVTSGEGGMIAVNDEKYFTRAEIIREKGTNRPAFFRGETDKYSWVDLGSSFMPSEITAAFLYAQLENYADIQAKRKKIWNKYYERLKCLEAKEVRLPFIPEFATNNGHMFYLICRSKKERTSLISYLKEKGIMAVFHYTSLHKSPFYSEKHDKRELPNSDLYSDCLVRLPLYCKLSEKDQSRVIEAILEFYK